MPDRHQPRYDDDGEATSPWLAHRPKDAQQRPAWGHDDPLPPRRPKQRIAGTPVDEDAVEATKALPPQAPAGPTPRRSFGGGRRTAARQPLPERLALPADEEAFDPWVEEDVPRSRGHQPPPPPPRGTHPAPPPAPAPRRRRRRPLLTASLLVFALLVGYLTWMWVAVDNVWQARGIVHATPAVDNRPAPGKGKNFLVVGSDARAGGDGDGVAGRRTDTIMLLHVPDSGNPTLVSIPRDSYVPIRANKASGRTAKHKINAAFSWGGPELLTDTVEQATGLRVDGYLEVGFSGFQESVDAVDGVDVCVANKLFLNDVVGTVQPGCQRMNGEVALAYVRARYDDPLGDIGRAQRQRQVLSVLIKKIASPGNILLPWRLEKVGTPVARILTMDDHTSRVDAAQFVLALRQIAAGQGTSTVVPVATVNLSTSDGSAVGWDNAKAKRLFEALRNDDPVPSDLVPQLPGQ